MTTYRMDPIVLSELFAMNLLKNCICMNNLYK